MLVTRRIVCIGILMAHEWREEIERSLKMCNGRPLRYERGGPILFLGSKFYDEEPLLHKVLNLPSSPTTALRKTLPLLASDARVLPTRGSSFLRVSRAQSFVVCHARLYSLSVFYPNQYSLFLSLFWESSSLPVCYVLSPSTHLRVQSKTPGGHVQTWHILADIYDNVMTNPISQAHLLTK